MNEVCIYLLFNLSLFYHNLQSLKSRVYNVILLLCCSDIFLFVMYSLISLFPPFIFSYQGPPSYQPYPTQNMYTTSTPLL